MTVQVNKLPERTIEFADGYHITPDAEIYQNCGNGEYLKSHKVKTGQGGYYTVLVNDIRRHVHSIYAEAYMDNYDPTKPVFFRDNNHENITLDNLTQDVKERSTSFFKYTNPICPACQLHRVHKGRVMCSKCESEKIRKEIRDGKVAKIKEQAASLSKIMETRKLKPNQEAIIYYMLQGLNQGEIANKIGINQSAVHSSIKRMEALLSEVECIDELPAGSINFAGNYYITPDSKIYKKISEEYVNVKVTKELNQIYTNVFYHSKDVDKRNNNINKNVVTKKDTCERKSKTPENLVDIPKNHKRYKENYLITKDAKVYKECGNDKCYQLKVQKIGTFGYLAVGIDGRTKYLHKIYAEVYMGNYDSSKPVYFKDGNKENITLENLTQTKPKQGECKRRKRQGRYHYD